MVAVSWEGRRVVEVQNKDFRGEESRLMTKFFCGIKNECLRWTRRSDLWSLEDTAAEKAEY